MNYKKSNLYTIDTAKRKFNKLSWLTPVVIVVNLPVHAQVSPPNEPASQIIPAFSHAGPAITADTQEADLSLVLDFDDLNFGWQILNRQTQTNGIAFSAIAVCHIINPNAIPNPSQDPAQEGASLFSFSTTEWHSSYKGTIQQFLSPSDIFAFNPNTGLLECAAGSLHVPASTLEVEGMKASWTDFFILYDPDTGVTTISEFVLTI